MRVPLRLVGLLIPVTICPTTTEDTDSQVVVGQIVTRSMTSLRTCINLLRSSSGISRTFRVSWLDTVWEG